MAYVNEYIERRSDVVVAKQTVLEAAELEFWKQRSEEFLRRFENIFEAIEEHGYIELTRHGGKKLTLCAKPVEKPEPPR